MILDSVSLWRSLRCSVARRALKVLASALYLAHSCPSFQLCTIFSSEFLVQRMMKGTDSKTRADLGTVSSWIKRVVCRFCIQSDIFR